MSISKLAWTWRQPAIPQTSASAERLRGRIITGMLTGDETVENVQGGTGGRDATKK